MGITRQFGFLVVTMVLLFVTGCASVPYRQGVSFDDPQLMAVPVDEVEIVRGRPHTLLDAADWVWPGSLLSKLVLWDWRVDRHEIGDETERVVRSYLTVNELPHVKVRLNQYAPGDELLRTIRNRSVGAGWRYTLGMVTWLQYTAFPGRFFGGDHYNPYANSINMYSDIPAIAVHEGGHAKDFSGRKWKGTYAFAYQIPFVNLYHEARASNDALGYLREHENYVLQREGYRIMHPAYGTYIGSNISQWVSVDIGYAIYGAAVIGGHITGRVRGATLPQEQ
ncbi:MAG TPA: hypothetical protein VKN62_01225 [Pelovirga sp.]|nr:hypothetical protein [Pelovirga sp.]